MSTDQQPQPSVKNVHYEKYKVFLLLIIGYALEHRRNEKPTKKRASRRLQQAVYRYFLLPDFYCLHRRLCSGNSPRIRSGQPQLGFIPIR